MQIANIMEEDVVLVTGASGYIATHIVQQLQRAGYKVRGTVRSLTNEEKVRPLRNLCPDAKYPVELVQANLLDPETWKSAVSGCRYVLHVASPPAEVPVDENVLIKPAVEGTVNVLKACREAKTVRRVVLTSSVAAISCCYDIGGDHVYTEEDWTDLKIPGVSPYNKSKTLAERAAWEFVESLGDEEKFDLVAIHPSFVIGPILCGAFTTSMELPKMMMEKVIPVLPNLNMGFVDVRDVAAAHIAAMTKPEAAGKRHILSSENLWVVEIAQLLVKEFVPQGYSIPTKVAPYPLLWLFSWFDKSIQFILPSIGKVTKYNTDRMLSVLDIKPKPVGEAFIDMCYSMIEAGKIKKTDAYKGPHNK